MRTRRWWRLIRTRSWCWMWMWMWRRQRGGGSAAGLSSLLSCQHLGSGKDEDGAAFITRLVEQLLRKYNGRKILSEKVICGAWYPTKVRWWGNIHYQISWAVAFSVKNEWSGATFMIRWTRLDDHLPKTILCFPKMTKWGINWYFQFRQTTWRLMGCWGFTLRNESFSGQKYFNLRIFDRE